VSESFHEQATEDVFSGVNSSAARRLCPQGLWGAGRKPHPNMPAVKESVEA
jgi:proteic killer suppression protein